MSREEAIEFGNLWLQMNEDCKDSSTYAFFQMAIKALEQEPCEDCVSRQFMYELGATCIAMRNENGKLIALGTIENLPSVTPQEPKTGHWIEDAEQHHVEKTYHCSECGHGVWGEYEKTEYCGGCGAKMVEPQESENKE